MILPAMGATPLRGVRFAHLVAACPARLSCGYSISRPASLSFSGSTTPT